MYQGIFIDAIEACTADWLHSLISLLVTLNQSVVES